MRPPEPPPDLQPTSVFHLGQVFVDTMREKMLGVPFKIRIPFPSPFEDQTMNCMRQMSAKTSSLAVSPSVQNSKSGAQGYVKT